MMENWRDGRFKLAIISMLLAQRRARPELFAAGNYDAIMANGRLADHVCAFTRATGDEAMLVVAARFPAKLGAEPGWGNTTIPWPQALASRPSLRNLLNGQAVERSGETVEVAAVLAEMPIAVLAPERGRH